MKECCKDILEVEKTDQPKPGKSMKWLKRIGVVGFVFFLLKGLMWIAVFYFGFKLFD